MLTVKYVLQCEWDCACKRHFPLLPWEVWEEVIAYNAKVTTAWVFQICYHCDFSWCILFVVIYCRHVILKDFLERQWAAAQVEVGLSRVREVVMFRVRTLKFCCRQENLIQHRVLGCQSPRQFQPIGTSQIMFSVKSPQWLPYLQHKSKQQNNPPQKKTHKKQQQQKTPTNPQKVDPELNLQIK